MRTDAVRLRLRRNLNGHTGGRQSLRVRRGHANNEAGQAPRHDMRNIYESVHGRGETEE